MEVEDSHTVKTRKAWSHSSHEWRQVDGRLT